MFVANEYPEDIPSIGTDVFKKLWAKVTTKT